MSNKLSPTLNQGALSEQAKKVFEEIRSREAKTRKSSSNYRMERPGHYKVRCRKSRNRRIRISREKV